MTGTVVGIDLGTTFSLVAEMAETGLRVFPAPNGRHSTPSVVLLNGDRVVVGDEAKRSAPLYPDRTFAFFKRDMGVPSAMRTVDGRGWSPAELSAKVLESLVADAERATSARPTRAVITVPAYFGDAARRATVDAGDLAGLDVLELIQEPTAAALAYGFGATREPRTILVYDLGGGTFDVSLVRVDTDGLQVVGTDGDHELGGKDWDDVLIGVVAERFAGTHGVDPRLDPAVSADLRERCEDAKRSLSTVQETTVPLVIDGVADRIRVTREEFETLSAPLLAATESLLQRVIQDAGLSWQAVAATVLVGGSTRMPACARLVERVTGKPASRGIDPDIAVVHGAALVAMRRATSTHGSQSSRAGLIRLPAIKDVTAHALGFVVINEAGDRYVNDVMIDRNSPIPAAATKVKRLEKGADELDVYVLQGHQERPTATESLGRYRFGAIPGTERARDVSVTFMYDGDGIVRVSAAIRGTELPAPQHDPDDTDLAWTDEDPRDHARGHLDAVLLIDCSGSMMGSKLNEAKDSCADFARILGELNGARVGLVSFADGARVESPLTEHGREVEAAARRLNLYGGTDLAAGLARAATVFDAKDARRVVVVVTDGEPNKRGAATSAAADCARRGIEIVTVGVSGADLAFLASIATTDRDSLFTDDMRGALRSIARSLAGGLTRRT